MNRTSPSARGPIMSVHRRPSRIALSILCLLSASRTTAAPPGDPVLTLTGHTGGVFHVAYSPDGKTLATSSKDCTARIWDAATGKPLFTLAGSRPLAERRGARQGPGPPRARGRARAVRALPRAARRARPEARLRHPRQRLRRGAGGGAALGIAMVQGGTPGEHPPHINLL